MEDDLHTRSEGRMGAPGVPSPSTIVGAVAIGLGAFLLVVCVRAPLLLLVLGAIAVLVLILAAIAMLASIALIAISPRQAHRILPISVLFLLNSCAALLSSIAAPTMEVPPLPAARDTRIVRSYLSLRHSPDTPDAVREAIRNLPTGAVAVDAPAKMFLDETRRVTVTITAGTREDLVKNLGSGQGNLTFDEIKVAARMRVELSGRAFEVVPIGDRDRLLGDWAEWQFDVTAKKSGTHQKMKVSIAVRLQLPGYAVPEARYHPVKEVFVDIEVQRLRRIVKSILQKAPVGLLALVGGTLAYFVNLKPVQILAVHLFNRLIGAHIGVELPADT